MAERKWATQEELDREARAEKEKEIDTAICLTMDMFTKNEFKQWCENNNYSMTKYLRNHVKQVAGIL